MKNYWTFSMTISVILLCLNPDGTSTFPILDIELIRLKSTTNGIATIVRYVDLPKSLFETFVLSCRIPTADRFEWKITTQMGSPFPAIMKVEMDFDREKPWERVVTNFLFVFIIVFYESAFPEKYF